MMDEYRRELWFKCVERESPLEVELDFFSYKARGFCCVTSTGELLICDESRTYFEFWPRPSIHKFDSYTEGNKKVYTICNEKIAIYDFEQVTLIGYGSPYEKMRIIMVSKENGKPIGSIIKKLPFIEEVENMLKNVARTFNILTGTRYDELLQSFRKCYLEISSPCPIGIVTPEDKIPFEILQDEKEILENFYILFSGK